MYELDKKYLERLEELAGEIQESEELQNYLEEEEEDYYMQLKENYEPRIAEIYEEVAAENPLQLVPLESILLDPAFEGLFLPKILGHAVLRGEINKDFKYVRPQDHFRDVLLAICQSPNFDILRKRIGQSIQMGFALSSDIWITNLINEIDNKRVRYFLQSQKLEKYRLPEERQSGYLRYKRQFQNDNYHTVEFPEDLASLKILASPLKSFLVHRITLKVDNSSILEPLWKFIDNKEFQGTEEHLEVMVLFAVFFDLGAKEKKHLAKIFNKVRKEMEEFDEKLLKFILELHHSGDLTMDPQADLRLSEIVDKSIDDELSGYFKTLDVVHTKGYVHEEAQDAVHGFYNQHMGLSLVNECIRKVIYDYFARYIKNLEDTAYTDFFEIAKLFPVYINIFANQQFNQDLKELSMNYVQLLLKKYTDKRGKDYQDIKKFVSTTFQDLGFLKEKEVIELFKTRRKRKKED